VLIALQHYFPQLSTWFDGVKDFRMANRTQFSSELLCQLVLWQRLSGIPSNNQFELEMEKSEHLHANLSIYLKREIPGLPSVDAICYYLRYLQPEELQNVVDEMISTLSRKKLLNGIKTADGYLLLAIDGVHVFSSSRSLDHATSRRHGNGKTTYHQYYLEAKIVGLNGMALSVHTESIENPEGEFDKQDCELKAFHRLIAVVKRKHPQMKFLVLLDSLYCNAPVISAIRAHGWGYSVGFKGAQQNRPLMDEFIEGINECRINCKTVSIRYNSKSELTLQLRWCNNASHTFGKALLNGLNYIEGTVSRKFADGRETSFKMAFIVHQNINVANALEVFQTGRQRWKIENQGFNFQKNHGLHLGHSFCSQGHAAHNYYLFAQMAHIILQLTVLSDIFKHWQKKQAKTFSFSVDSLLQLLQSFKCIFNQIRLELFDKTMTLYEFSDLRIRLRTG
jgi:hypothetical protein